MTQPTPAAPADQMRVAIGITSAVSDAELKLAAQMGCSGVVVPSPPFEGGLRWSYEDIARLRERVESYGLRLEAIQNMRLDLFDEIRLARPGRETQLEDFKTTLRNLGRAGVPIFAYNWRPNRLYRTGHVETRGGARASAFDVEQARDLPLSHGRVYRAEELWDNFTTFVKAVMPVAEEAGVKLAHHPDDPPLPDGPHLGGVPRIFSSFEGFKRGMEIADSPNWGLLFCMGCWSEMGGNDYVLNGLRYFGERGKLFYIHFRDVRGTGDRFHEVFIGDGQVDLVAALKVLKEVNFTGFLIDDHTPHMEGDGERGWGTRGRLFQTGYIQGLLRAVNDLI
ncbi:MAG TPA: mannonate dehydratase [Chloroflexota bacterium]|nr:mannonate dehydratase [Chloroflexota bacterium]